VDDDMILCRSLEQHTRLRLCLHVACPLIRSKRWCPSTRLKCSLSETRITGTETSNQMKHMAAGALSMCVSAPRPRGPVGPCAC